MAENIIQASDRSVSEVIEECLSSATALGMDLSYSPSVLLEDISTLSIDEWREKRREMIGGSDAGTVMGVSSRSLTRLVLEKQGKWNAPPADRKLQFIFDWGHAAETVSARHFGRVTGFEVFRDNRMFAHPHHPWMGGDVDAFCIDAEGYQCGIELKTANPMFLSRWYSGVYGQDATVYRQEYIWQIRHYMAVTNLFRWYLVIMFDNNADNVVIIRVDRDMQAEKELISAEENVWKNYVLTGAVPKESTFEKDEYQQLRDGLGLPEADKAADRKLLDEADLKSLEEFIRLSDQKSDLEKQKKEIEERQNALRLHLEEELGEAVEGYLPSKTEPQKEYVVSNPLVTREGADLSRLKTLHPEIFQEVRTASDSRRFSVKLKAVKRKKS